MRELLSDLLVEAATADDRFLVLSGDHGYALFDALRARRPGQFLNVGVAEQNMVGVAAGLARTGFRPCVYGLAAFVPVRVLEQIKLDLCHARLPVILLGDGAGLVYATLGVSHQCGEDLACLAPLPHIAIYSPCDAEELRACWAAARAAEHPSYIRLGKADRPAVHGTAVPDTEPRLVHPGSPPDPDALLIATGSMVSVAVAFARDHGLPCLSVPRIKPFPDGLLPHLRAARRVAVLEEHARHGGLWSGIVHLLAERSDPHAAWPRVEFLGLQERFTASAGGYQHALGEHALSDDDVRRRLTRWLASG